MLRQDKNSSNGAPSLLTPAQQAEAERNRILSTLEASPERKRASKPTGDAASVARAPWVWALCGLLLMALAGGAGLWYGQQGAPVTPAIVAQSDGAAIAPPPAESATAADAGTAGATIENDNANQAGAAPETQQSLSDMLSAEPPSAPAAPAGAGPGADVLSQALEAPSGSALAGAAAAPVAARAVSKAATPAKPTPPVKRAPVQKAPPAPKPAPAPAPDGDVMLLSALIAHAQAAEPPVAIKPRQSLQQELAWCKKQDKMPFSTCRVRACDGRATAAACKVKR